MSPRGIFTHVGIILHLLDCLGQVYAGKDKKIDFFGRFFGEKSVFGGGGKDLGGKIFCKKIGKKSAKIADFSEKIRYFPEKIRFFPKKSDFSRYLCKLYFRSLREEILKNGANQSCRIKKKCTFGKNNSCLVH